MDNSGSERALRPIAIGRKAWLFCGSDDHATAAGNLFSLVASCKLHALDPEAYLADVLRVMPRDRSPELAPKSRARTRARLGPTELARPARPLGHITVPGPLPPEQQPPPR